MAVHIQVKLTHEKSAEWPVSTDTCKLRGCLFSSTWAVIVASYEMSKEFSIFFSLNLISVQRFMTTKLFLRLACDRDFCARESCGNGRGGQETEDFL